MNINCTKYSYDALDRLTNERCYGGSTTGSTLQKNTTYTYDLRDNLTDANEGTGNVRTTFSYDVLDRVTQTTVTPVSTSRKFITTYTYFADDQVQNRSGYNNTLSLIDNVTTYTYDGLGRLQNVNESVPGTPAGNKQATFTYLATGQVETVQRAGGAPMTSAATSTYSYDNMGRTTSIATGQGTFSYLYTYAYDAASRITREDSPSGAVTYTYYNNDQLSGADYNYRADETFAWDENGNPTGTGFVIGKGDRLISDGTTTYQYDAEGNRTQQTAGTVVTTYTWDQRNRLTGATRKNSGTATMVTTQVYDSFNRRTDDITDPDGAGPLGQDKTAFWWDGDHLQGQRNSVSGSITDHFLMGPGIDNVLAHEKQGTINWTVTDVRGSVVEVLDGTGASKTRKTYSGFGEKTDAGNPSVVDTVFAYTGREFDADLGLQYNRNRWYDPSAKRWLSEDPAQDDHNASRYVGNNPPNNTDPSGLLQQPPQRQVPTMDDPGRDRSRGIGVLPVPLPAANPKDSAEYWKKQARARIDLSVYGESSTDPNRLRNFRITAAYAELYLKDKRLLWAGLAAMASDLIGKTMANYDEMCRNARRKGDPTAWIMALEALIRKLGAGNKAVFDDLYWQHLAFLDGGAA